MKGLALQVFELMNVLYYLARQMQRCVLDNEHHKYL